MSRFTVSGLPRNPALRPEKSATWEHGRLRSDAAYVAAIEEEARALEGHSVGPHEGPYTGRNHLRSALSAAIIMGSLLFTKTIQMSGDIPRRPDIPDGAIGADVKGDDSDGE